MDISAPFNTVMTALPRRPSEIADDALRQCLERSLPQLAEKQSALVGISRASSSYSSYYSTEIIDVGLSTGEHLKFFLKDFGTYNKELREGLAEMRERELRVYRDLLTGAHLGTAAYYGSEWSESEGRFWILLEFVSGTPLRHLKTEDRVLAAAWLGRLHGYFARESERFLACSELVRHDERFFWSNAESAVGAVSLYSISLAARVEAVLRHYGEAVQVMVNEPSTFVHGCYTPTQILYDAERQRICPIDWEVAAIGSPLYDLAILSDGYEPPKLYQFFDAYTEAALENGISVVGREEMKRVVDCFRLHRARNALGKCARKQYSEKSVVKLVNACEQLVSLIF
jgi:aminoglycoside phosphotransferase (APT) family kinase protein